MSLFFWPGLTRQRHLCITNDIQGLIFDISSDPFIQQEVFGNEFLLVSLSFNYKFLTNPRCELMSNKIE